jgi:hypothetical protein
MLFIFIGSNKMLKTLLLISPKSNILYPVESPTIPACRQARRVGFKALPWVKLYFYRGPPFSTGFTQPPQLFMGDTLINI